MELKFPGIENAFNHAVELVQKLGGSAEETIGKLSAESHAAMSAKFFQDITKRIQYAAEMGDVTTLNAIAAEIMTQPESCVPLTKQIVQMVEDFDLDGIQKLADDLDER